MQGSIHNSPFKNNQYQDQYQDQYYQQDEYQYQSNYNRPDQRTPSRFDDNQNDRRTPNNLAPDYQYQGPSDNYQRNNLSTSQQKQAIYPQPIDVQNRSQSPGSSPLELNYSQNKPPVYQQNQYQSDYQPRSSHKNIIFSPMKQQATSEEIEAARRSQQQNKLSIFPDRNYGSDIGLGNSGYQNRNQINDYQLDPTRGSPIQNQGRSTPQQGQRSIFNEGPDFVGQGQQSQGGGIFGNPFSGQNGHAQDHFQSSPLKNQNIKGAAPIDPALMQSPYRSASPQNVRGGHRLSAGVDISPRKSASPLKSTKPLSVLIGVQLEALLPKQDNLTFAGPERYTQKSDFVAALLQKGQYMDDLLANQFSVVKNAQEVLFNFDKTKLDISRNLVSLETEFLESHTTAETFSKSSPSVSKIERLSKEIDRCKSLSQDALILQDSFKTTVDKDTKRNLPELNQEFDSLLARLYKELQPLERDLGELQRLSRDRNGATQADQKAVLFVAELNFCRDVYLESWNRINNLFLNLSEAYQQRSNELLALVKRYNETYNIADYQSEIRIMEQHQQKTMKINGTLTQMISQTLAKMFLPGDTNLPYMQIKKREQYKKVIQEQQKTVEELKKEIKALKNSIKSYRDPSNAKTLASQRIRYKISDGLSEEIRTTEYRAENTQLVCDVLLNLENDEIIFKDLYQTDKNKKNAKDQKMLMSQVETMEMAAKLKADAEKGGKKAKEDTEKNVDKCCRNFNGLISEYIQIRERLDKYDSNKDVKNALGPLISEFKNKVDLNIKKCMLENQSVIALRYLGGVAESKIVGINVEAFQAEYNKFMATIDKDYKKIDTFILHEKTAQGLLSSCRVKNTELKDLKSKYVLHEKTEPKVNAYVKSLDAIDDNLTLLSECILAAIKIKNTTDELVKASSDIEKNDMRAHLKDERDLLVQAAQYKKNMKSENAKESEVPKRVVEHYCPLFSQMGEIYDVVLKYFYNKEGLLIFKDHNLNKAETLEGLTKFQEDITTLSNPLQDEQTKNLLLKSLPVWQKSISKKLK
jgi:hypothetical protein